MKSGNFEVRLKLDQRLKSDLIEESGEVNPMVLRWERNPKANIWKPRVVILCEAE